MTIPPPPQPPAPSVRRFTADGKPTEAQVTYEQRVIEWQRAVAAAIAAGN